VIFLTCSFSLNYFKLKFNYKLTINLIDKSNCDSKGCVYIIKCKKYKHIYISETSRSISCRIKDHHYSIDSFIPYSKHTPVSSHFNFVDHNNAAYTHNYI